MAREGVDYVCPQLEPSARHELHPKKDPKPRGMAARTTTRDVAARLREDDRHMVSWLRSGCGVG